MVCREDEILPIAGIVAVLGCFLLLGVIPAFIQIGQLPRCKVCGVVLGEHRSQLLGGNK